MTPSINFINVFTYEFFCTNVVSAAFSGYHCIDVDKDRKKDKEIDVEIKIERKIYGQIDRVEMYLGLKFNYLNRASVKRLKIQI